MYHLVMLMFIYGAGTGPANQLPAGATPVVVSTFHSKDACIAAAND